MWLTLGLSFATMSIRSPRGRYLSGAILGMFILAYSYGFGSLFCVVLALACYVLLAAHVPHSAALTWIFSMGFLCYLQWQKYVDTFDGWALDYVGPLMVFVQKITMLAHNLNDGRRMAKGQKLRPRQESYALSSLPKISEYLAYIFFFPSVMFGPSFEYKDYNEYIHRPTQRELRAKTKDGSIMPRENRIRAVVRYGATGALFVPLALYSFNGFPAEFMLQPAFMSMPLYKRALYGKAVASLFRIKYYFAWIMADAFCAAAGFGLHEVNGKMVYGRYSNVHILKLEFATSVFQSTTSWNRGTNRWLKYYVYERVTYLKSMRTVLTYLVSALWHGFYPGYYCFFVGLCVGTIAHRAQRKVIRPIVLAMPEAVQVVYNIIGIICTTSFIDFCEIGFVMMTLGKVHTAWSTLYYAPLVGAAALWIFCQIIIVLRPKQRAEKVKKDE